MCRINCGREILVENERTIMASRISARQVFPELSEDASLDIVQYRHVKDNLISRYVPAADKTFTFPVRGDRNELSPLDILLMFYQFGKPGEGCYIYGPTGCGKSSLVRQFCSRCGIGLMFITGHENMTITDLLGGLRIINGNSVFNEG